MPRTLQADKAAKIRNMTVILKLMTEDNYSYLSERTFVNQC